MDDTELETVFRDGPRRRAEKAEIPADLVDRIVPTRDHRRLALLAAIGAVAAVVVVAVGLDAVQVTHRPDRTVSDHRGADRSASDVSGWRTEAWHGLQVSVPADWGWGTAPIVQGGQKYLCGDAGSRISADGRRAESGGAWVGRPIMLSDACQGGDVLTEPTAPYVWLGADIAPGTVKLGNGYTQQTVEVEGTSLTVATTDAGLRQRILDSATGGASFCSTRLAEPPSVPFRFAGDRQAEFPRGQVCAYQRSGTAFDLVYATRLSDDEAQDYEDAIYDGGFENDHRFCADHQEYVVVGVRVQVTSTTVIDVGCAQVAGGVGSVAPISSRALDIVTRNGIPVVLSSLIGPQG